MRLIFHDQHGRERNVDVGFQRPRVTIGRNADCIIQTNNASVSREHAVVTFQNGQVIVHDPPPGPPTNGTYINGQRLRPGEVGRLSVGDELRCGNFAIRAVAAPNDGPAYAPPQQQSPQPAHRQPAPQQQGEWAQQPQQPPPVQSQAFAPPQHGGGPGVSREDYEQLVRENIGLKTVEQRQREQIEHLQNQNLDKERVLADFERRAQQHENVVEGLNDKIARLKEQLELQKDQMRGLREELKNRNNENEDLEFRLQEIQRAMTERTGASANSEQVIADLKVQINQRDRRVEELQRDLDLAQYALTTEKDNVERLEMTLTQVNEQGSDFDRYRADMQKVIEQHESTISDLRRAIEDRDRDREKLIAQIDTLGGANQQVEGELRTQVQELQNQLRTRDDEMAELEGALRRAERAAGQSIGGGDDSAALRAQIDELQAELEVARAGGGGGGGAGRVRELMQQLNELKRENRDLRMNGGGGDGGAGGGDEAMKRRVMELEREVEEARGRLRDMSSKRGGGDEIGEMKRRARDVYQAINDVVSAWRDDMQALELFIEDLQRLMSAYQRIDMSSLNTVDRVRLEGVVEEVDPKITFEELSGVVQKNQKNASSIKSSLRELREVVM